MPITSPISLAYMYTCTRVLHQQNKNICGKIVFILTCIYNNLYIICEGGVLKMGHRITECNPPTRSFMVIPVAIIYVHVLYICYSMVMIKAHSLTLNQFCHSCTLILYTIIHWITLFSWYQNNKVKTAPARLLENYTFYIIFG